MAKKAKLTESIEINEHVFAHTKFLNVLNARFVITRMKSTRKVELTLLAGDTKQISALFSEKT